MFVFGSSNARWTVAEDALRLFTVVNMPAAPTGSDRNQPFDSLHRNCPSATIATVSTRRLTHAPDLKKVDDIGHRVRCYRRLRGLSVRTASKLAGISPAFLSTIENGHRPLDRISHIVAIAEALRISPAELVGPAFIARVRTDVCSPLDATAIRLRSTLVVAPLHVGSAALITVEELESEVNRVADLVFTCRYDQAFQQLSPLIGHAHALLASGSCRREKLLRQLIVTIYQCLCVPVMKELRYPDLLALVLERLQVFARESGDPLQQMITSWQQAQLCARMGLYAESAAIAESTANQLVATGLATADAHALYGRLHITAALAHARQTQQRPLCFDHLAEARSIAVRFQSRPQGLLRLTRTSIMLNTLELLCVLKHFDDARTTIDDLVAIKELDVVDKYSFHLLAGATTAYSAHDQETAVQHLQIAEHLSPHALITDPYARGAVIHLVAQPSYDSVNASVRRLSHRMGVL